MCQFHRADDYGPERAARRPLGRPARRNSACSRGCSIPTHASMYRSPLPIPALEPCPATTLTWVSGETFSLYWVTGGNGHIRLSANNDACTTPPASTTSTEYAIAGFVDGNHLTVSGTPPDGNVYWCANNFAVMVWRDQAPTDGSTVTLTAASMAAVESRLPPIRITARVRLVSTSRLTAAGSVFMAASTGSIHHGSTAYYGYMVASGRNGSGNSDRESVANGMVRSRRRDAEIDQTQANLTFYTVAQDPNGGGPLVIQGVFKPPRSLNRPFLTAMARRFRMPASRAPRHIP